MSAIRGLQTPLLWYLVAPLPLISPLLPIRDKLHAVRQLRALIPLLLVIQQFFLQLYIL